MYRECSIEFCDKKYWSNGFCQKHWARWYRNGTIKVRKKYTGRCRFKGCNKNFTTYGYCRVHYEQIRRTQFKQTVIYIYSKGKNKCECCGEKNKQFLSIDHIKNNGAKHRKENNISSSTMFYNWLIDNDFPEDYQVYCFNCNLGKHINGGVCPHVSNMQFI
ncbi:hypothetical protein LCGC14_1081520 [marine sediment metagenome]|uniref:HNH nuclease domain-containing protein n=1 Tax=marine sediment metagenome TaxID=412755 RepID=A0A0F9PY91_9ZZZZ